MVRPADVQRYPRPCGGVKRQRARQQGGASAALWKHESPGSPDQPAGDLTPAGIAPSPAPSRRRKMQTGCRVNPAHVPSNHRNGSVVWIFRQLDLENGYVRRGNPLLIGLGRSMHGHKSRGLHLAAEHPSTSRFSVAEVGTETCGRGEDPAAWDGAVADRIILRPGLCLPPPGML